MGFLGLVASAVVMFATTNIDDALVLVVCFANAAEGKDGLQSRHVWIGQFLGFSIIMALALIGTFVGSFLPPHYSGLLGFVPLLMGLWRMKAWCKKENGSTEGREHALPGSRRSSTASIVQEERTSGQALAKDKPAESDEPSSGYQLHGVTPKARESSVSSDLEVEQPTCSQTNVNLDAAPSGNIEDFEEGRSRSKMEKSIHTAWWPSIFSVHSLKLVAMTLANGGDNVAVYIPGLVTYNAGEILLTVAIFYVLLALWLYAAVTFVSFRFVAEFIEKYGDYIIPVALVLLGIYILWSADVLSLV
ncbi:cadmium resistance protein CadD [Phytophthora cinnamomi]|uniref:cadmium resistance protein CadD n=1 Tax=Phytophthora cinnamomi TaxID=4785 RepID=UPI003559DDBB|nr:cadmium resistance protein CadD [Phytophthora cinnamomi]